jgi:hypothetical protein
MINHKPSCPYGYTKTDLESIFGNETAYKAFMTWMVGQTMAICEGREYSYELKAYEPTECSAAPHGMVVYTWDLAQYLRGGGPLD